MTKVVCQQDSATVSETEIMDLNAEIMMNLSLLDPPHYGWTAAGGIADLLPPVEVIELRKQLRNNFIQK